jgi:hypothetical protein
MTATIGVSFLGLSIGCARCHDHKFDPITAQDYYRFASTFTSAIRSEKTFDLAPEENKKRRDEFEQSLRQAKSELANYEQAGLGREVIDFLKRSIEDNAATLSGPWNVLSGTLSTENGSKYVLQADGSFLATGNSPGKETLVFECKLDLTKARALRIEALSDPSLPRGGPGRADNGNFALGNMTAEIVSEGRRINRMGTVSRLLHPSIRILYQGGLWMARLARAKRPCCSLRDYQLAMGKGSNPQQRYGFRCGFTIRIRSISSGGFVFQYRTTLTHR